MDFNSYTDSYSDHVADALSVAGVEQSDYFLLAKADQLLEILRKRGDPQQMTMLDVGCGIGLLEAHLAGKLKRIVGVDVAADAVRISARTVPGASSFLTYDGIRLPFPDGTFDASIAVCVLHHVQPEQCGAVVAEMARVTKPGGLLMIFEHNPWNPVTRFVVSHCEFDRDAILLPPTRVSRLLREATATSPMRRFLFFFPWRSALWRGIERFLGWLPLGAQYVALAERR